MYSHALAQTTPNNFYHPSIDIPLALISMFQYEPTIISDPIPVAVEKEVMEPINRQSHHTPYPNHIQPLLK